MKKNTFNLLVGLSSGLILLGVIFFTNGIGSLFEQLSKLNPFWLTLACLLMILKWIFESGALHTITKLLYMKQSFSNSFKVTMIGQFFNSVTPLASGGQPAQMYVLAKDGIEPGRAGSILMVKFIVFQSVLTSIALLVIIFKATFFRSQVSHFFFLAMIGFAVNVAVIAFAILFARYQAMTHKILMFIFHLLKKFRFVKDEERAERVFEEQLISFHQNASTLRKNPGLLIRSTLLTILQLLSFYAIPYCVYRSFGLSGAGLINMISAQAFVMMTTAFVPLPGAAGGAEGGFYLFFNIFFKSQKIVSAILIWRLITYYSNIAFGGLVATFAPEKPLESM